MAYRSGQRFPYIDNNDWYQTPYGEVGFFRDDIPEQIKKRLIEDLKKEKDKHKDDILCFE